MKNNKYHVYLHINPIKKEIFYVGYGQGKRAYHFKGRSQYWHNIVNKYGDPIVVIVKKDISLKYAKKLEIAYIKIYGRRNMGLGPLVNLTNGGEGNNGVIVSKETKKKLSDSHKGLIPGNKGKKGYFKHTLESLQKISDTNKGKKHSEETKEKMSKNRKGITLGRKLTEEHKNKISLSNKGENNAFYGRKHSEETRRKISETKRKNRELKNNK